MSAALARKDNRDPRELGEALIRQQVVDDVLSSDESDTMPTLREVYDRNVKALQLVPATEDADPVQKYGDPRAFSVKIHTRREIIRHHPTPTEKLCEGPRESY